MVSEEGEGGALREEFHYGPAKNQPDLMLRPWWPWTEAWSTWSTWSAWSAWSAWWEWKAPQSSRQWFWQYTSSGSSRTTTPHSLQANSGETPGNEVKVLIRLIGTFKVLTTINDRIDIYPAVDSCADDACPVGTLKVAFHDLVQFSITQTLEYQ